MLEMKRTGQSLTDEVFASKKYPDFLKDNMIIRPKMNPRPMQNFHTFC